MTTNDNTPEELEEQEFFDGVYGKLSGEWKLDAEDWEKFSRMDRVTDGYSYSVKALGDVTGKNILDFGCGNGWLSVLLAKMGANVSGFDISDEAIRVATSMAECNGVSDSTRFRVGSAYNVDFPDESFELIIGQAILHHLEDKERLSKEIDRLLRPGGKAVFYECFGDSLILERIRLWVPVATEGAPHWDEQLKYADVEVLNNLFDVRYKEFGLLSRLDRVVKSRRIKRALQDLDYFILERIQFLRRFARTIVVELHKKNQAFC